MRFKRISFRNTNKSVLILFISLILFNLLLIQPLYPQDLLDEQDNFSPQGQQDGDYINIKVEDNRVINEAPAEPQEFIVDKIIKVVVTDGATDKRIDGATVTFDLVKGMYGYPQQKAEYSAATTNGVIMFGDFLQGWYNIKATLPPDYVDYTEENVFIDPIKTKEVLITMERNNNISFVDALGDWFATGGVGKENEMLRIIQKGNDIEINGTQLETYNEQKGYTIYIIDEINGLTARGTYIHHNVAPANNWTGEWKASFTGSVVIINYYDPSTGWRGTTRYKKLERDYLTKSWKPSST